jgi:hypothetical protein
LCCCISSYTLIQHKGILAIIPAGNDYQTDH